MKKNHCKFISVQKTHRITKLLRVMKLTLILFFVSVFSVFAENTYSQNAKISINKENVYIQDILNEIENQTDYLFLYNKKNVNVNRQTTVKASKVKVSKVLDDIFKDTDVIYDMVGNHIVLTSRSAENAVSEAPQQNRISITGVVTDETNEPIVGANVVEKGTTNGIITDIDGKFTLNVGGNAVLQISYIGYISQEIRVGNQTTFSIQMMEDTQALEEIVVVGYGTQRKKDIAGAISTMSGKDLQIQSVNNVQTLFQGRLPGVSVVNSALPGESSVVRIRGVGTLSDNNPLYVIDGLPTKDDILSVINPASIESIQVLKDAASASIYGAQAANGVILITTKQGSEGKTTVDIRLNTGVRVPTNLPEVLNSQQYGEVLWDAMRNAGMTPSHAQYGSGASPVIPDYIIPYGASEGSFNPGTYNTEQNQYMRANKKGTNWGKEVFKPASTTTVDLSLQGGNKDSKHFFNANYVTEDKVVKYGEYDKLSLRSNSRFTIFKNVTIGSNLNVHYENNKGSSSVGDAIYVAPLIPVYDIMGNWAGAKANGLGDQINPVADLYNKKDNFVKRYRFLGNAFMEIKFLENFQFRSDVGAILGQREDKTFTPLSYWNKGDKNTLVNSLVERRDKALEMTWNNTLNYSKVFNENHTVAVLLGTEAKSYEYNRINASIKNFAVEDNDYRFLDAGEIEKDASGEENAYTLFSLFSRINYQYKDKYYIGAVIRRDGSSRFGENNKYGYFPGVNAAWRLSEEGFMDFNFLNDFKIRASYGKTGNQDIGNYAFASTYGTNINHSSYPILGDPNSVTQGISKEAIGNQNIKWETTTSSNIGFDATLFNNRLTLGFDYFVKKTTDILQRVAYPATGGVASAPYLNIGEIQNKGLEFSANYRGASGRDFNYDVGFTIFGYRNEVLKLANNQFISSGDFNRTEVGRPLGSFYGFILDGIFQTQEEVDNHATQTAKAVGRWIFRDVNGDGRINDSDRTFIGNPHPDFEYSINGRFQYKNFDLLLFIQGTYGNDLCFASKRGQTSTDFWGDYSNKSTRILDSWTTENRNAELPEISLLNPNNESNRVTTYLIEDGSYIRLKTLELGYTLPSSVLSKIGFRQTRFFINAENLLTLTKYNNIDPEVRSTNDQQKGVDYVNNVPISKYFSAGFSLTF